MLKYKPILLYKFPSKSYKFSSYSSLPCHLSDSPGGLSSGLSTGSAPSFSGGLGPQDSVTTALKQLYSSWHKTIPVPSSPPHFLPYSLFVCLFKCFLEPTFSSLLHLLPLPKLFPSKQLTPSSFFLICAKSVLPPPHPNSVLLTPLSRPFQLNMLLLKPSPRWK